MKNLVRAFKRRVPKHQCYYATSVFGSVISALVSIACYQHGHHICALIAGIVVCAFVFLVPAPDLDEQWRELDSTNTLHD